MRPAVFLLCASLAACGGSSPASPTPVPEGPREWSLSGSLADVVTGEAIRGATLTFSGQPAVSTSDSGTWSIRGTGTAVSRMTVTIEAPGFLKRDTAVTWNIAGRSDIRLDLIPDRAPFSLAYYRELVRNGFETPDTLEPVRRWTRPPNFYLNTTNPRTGSPLDGADIERIQAAIHEALPQLTGGQFGPGAIELAAASRERRPDYITVNFVDIPDADYCGQAFVGANAGEITMNYGRCPTPCGNFAPETLAHEIGHAMGYWHTQGTGIMNPNRLDRSRQCANLQFSAEEKLHARVAYARWPGNLDLDVDPVSYAAMRTSGDAPLVICRR